MAMAVVGFATLFAGILAPQAATASTAALLTFVLPVAVAQPTTSIGPRLLGWALAGAFCIPACMVLWPTPWHDDLRRRLAGHRRGHRSTGRGARRGTARSPSARAVGAELQLLRDQFAATPYPPTGAATSAVAVARLVGRVEWAAGNATLVDGETAALELPTVRALLQAAAETLQLSSSLICDHEGHPAEDPRSINAVQQSTRRLHQLIATDLDADVSTLIDPQADPIPGTTDRGYRGGLEPTGHPPDTLLLDPSFHARAFGIATAIVANAALEAAGAQPVAGEVPEVTDAGSSQPVLASTRLASLCALGVVPQRSARRRRSGLGGRGHRDDRCRARLLGGPGRVVGVAVQCAGHGSDGPARRRRDGCGFRGGLGDHDRGRRRTPYCCGYSSPLQCWSPGWLRP